MDYYALLVVYFGGSSVAGGSFSLGGLRHCSVDLTFLKNTYVRKQALDEGLLTDASRTV